MPPTLHIHLGDSQNSPCNASEVKGGICSFSVQLHNLTLASGGEGGQDDSARDYDAEGAMKFVIVVLLVYSLVGTTGMLILRIRKSATRRENKKVDMKEANQYLKQRHVISTECQRERRKLETTRCIRHMQHLERQKSCTESHHALIPQHEKYKPLDGESEPSCGGASSVEEPSSPTPPLTPSPLTPEEVEEVPHADSYFSCSATCDRDPSSSQSPTDSYPLPPLQPYEQL